MENKKKFTTAAYIEIEKSRVCFESPTDIIVNLDKDNSFYISKYDLTNYEFKNTFLFKIKMEKDYIIYNRIERSKIKLSCEKLINAIKEFKAAIRIDIVNV